MALHGPVYVNNEKIGEWSAVNKGRTGAFYGANPEYAYDCVVHMYGSGKQKFAVYHDRADGAAALMAIIFSRYQQIKEETESG